MTIRLRCLRTLDLASSSGRGRPRFISAASGLATAGKWLYVVADDEVHLGVFAVNGSTAGQLVRLLPGKLPHAPNKRKARKADFEVLTPLPRFAGFPHGALLALGSGSRPNRRRGVLVALDSSGALHGSPRIIDLSALYLGLEKQLGALNVEGAVVLGQHLCLLNRGHPRKGGSAVVWLRLSAVLGGIASGNAVGAGRCRVRHYDLGRADGVPLGFTDGAALPGGGIVFTAVAESADDSYVDGPCVGAAVGVLGPDGELEWLRKLSPVLKVEGIAVRPGSRGREVLLVTDADDATLQARLYMARLSPGSATTLRTRR